MTYKTVENIGTLKQMGLSDGEAAIYLELLRMGGVPASAIAKAVGIKRTTIYPILQHLAEKGFVTVQFRHNERFYYAQKPNRVAGIFSKKLDNFYALIPSLQSLERKEIQKTGLRYIETVNELKEFYLGILDEYHGKEYRIIGNAKGWEDLDPDWFRQFRVDRSRNKIKTRLLLTHDSREINPTDEALLREFRYLPPQYQFKSTIDIYDDKMLVVSAELASSAIVIEIPAMRDIFVGMFDMLWDIAAEPVPVEKGSDMV